MPSVSGLSRQKRNRARERVVQAALLGLHNKDEVRYTDPFIPSEAALRWDGIKNRRKARLGQFSPQFGLLILRNVVSVERSLLALRPG